MSFPWVRSVWIMEGTFLVSCQALSFEASSWKAASCLTLNRQLHSSAFGVLRYNSKPCPGTVTSYAACFWCLLFPSPLSSRLISQVWLLGIFFPCILNKGINKNIFSWGTTNKLRLKFVVNFTPERNPSVFKMSYSGIVKRILRHLRIIIIGPDKTWLDISLRYDNYGFRASLRKYPNMPYLFKICTNPHI